MTHVDISRDRLERLKSMGVADYLHMALLNRIEELEAKLKTYDEIGRALEEDAGQLRAKLAKAVEAANFLSDRLNEFDLIDDADDMCRNFIGHIEPAHARMCATLTEINGGGDT